MSEKIAIKIEGNNVVVEKKRMYLKLVSEPNLPFLLSFKIDYSQENLDRLYHNLINSKILRKDKWFRLYFKV
jgi:hypothetical protein